MAKILLSTLMDALGGPVPVDAVLTFTATRSRASGAVVVANGTVTVRIVAGVPTEDVDLVPSGVDWAYKATLSVSSIGRRIDRTVAVPDVPSVEWADLVDVDPATGVPDPGAVPAWEAAVNAVALSAAASAAARDASVSARDAAVVARVAAEAASGASGAAQFNAQAARDTAVAASATATTKAAEASANAAAAEAAKLAAQAVGDTSDTIMTNVAADPSSLFTAQLSATIAAPAKHKPQRALVAFTFDDNSSNDLTIVKPILDARGVKGGFAWVTGTVGASGKLDWADGLLLQSEGHEILAHSVTHPISADLIAATEAVQRDEINGSRDALVAHGFRITGFVWPGTHSSAPLRAIAREKHLYALGGLGTGSAVQPLATYSIERMGTIKTGATWTAVKDVIDAAVAAKKFLIFYCHPGYDLDSAAQLILGQAIDYVQSLGVPIVTPRQGFELVGNQLDVGDLPGGVEYTVIAGDGTVRSTSLVSSVVVKGAINSVTPSTGSGDFESGKITVTALSTVTGNPAGSGWPHEGVVANVLTNRVETAGSGYTYQEFVTATSRFVRRAVGPTTWGAWTRIGDKLSVRTGITAALAPNAFEVGMETRAVASTAGNTDWPVTGVRATIRVDALSAASSYTYMRQEFLTDSAIYVRYATSSSAWGAWKSVALT